MISAPTPAEPSLDPINAPPPAYSREDPVASSSTSAAPCQADSNASVEEDEEYPLEKQLPPMTDGFMHRQVSPGRELERLVQPVIIPQLGIAYHSPFKRAYAPVLARSGVEMQDWLEFLDDLNIAMAAPAPAAAVSAVAGFGKHSCLDVDHMHLKFSCSEQAAYCPWHRPRR